MHRLGHDRPKSRCVQSDVLGTAPHSTDELIAQEETQLLDVFRQLMPLSRMKESSLSALNGQCTNAGSYGRGRAMNRSVRKKGDGECAAETGGRGLRGCDRWSWGIGWSEADEERSASEMWRGRLIYLEKVTQSQRKQTFWVAMQFC
jgi:hypothetical protein